MYRADGCENGVIRMCVQGVCGRCGRRGGAWLRVRIYVWFWRDSVRSRSHPISDPGRRRRGIINETDFVPISRGIPGTFHLRQIRPNSTRPVTVPRNTTRTVFRCTITCACTIRSIIIILSQFFSSSFGRIINYITYNTVRVRCVIRITVMVFTRYEPRSRGPNITSTYLFYILLVLITKNKNIIL